MATSRRTIGSLFAARNAFILLGIVCALALMGIFVAYSNRTLTLSELRARYVSGLYGVTLISPGSASEPSFDPWVALEKNASFNVMIGQLCADAGLDLKCGTAPDTRFRLFTKDHTVMLGNTPYILERNITPVAQTIDEPLLTSRMQLMAQWFKANQRQDGSLPYLYHPSSDTYASNDYVIRQILSVQGMFSLSRQLGDESLHADALRAESHLFSSSYRYDSKNGYGYFVESDGIRLGAAALGILMIREEGDKTRPMTEKERELAVFILSLQRPDGSFQTFLQDKRTDLDDRFYSGEALTALAQLYAVTKDPAYHAALEKGLAFYNTKLHADFWPQYAPWHMQAYATLYAADPQEQYKNYVFLLADGLIQTMLQEDVNARDDEKGRFYNPKYPDWGPPHSASTAIYVEGLTYAYELAKKVGDSAREELYRDAIVQGTRSLLEVQWTPEETYYLQHPERAVGSLKVSITDNTGRIDQVGHAANALSRTRTTLFGQSQ